MAEAAGEQRPRPGSVVVGHLLGIELRVHWTFALLLGLVAWANWSLGAGKVVAGLAWILAIFGSVLLHELAHCVVARRYGIVVEDILLIPIGGISQMRTMPREPERELKMAIAGPATSLGLGLLFSLATVVVGAQLWPPTLLAGSWPARLAWLNVMLGLFNLLPALPMDGGRVLRAALAMHEDRRVATRQAARIARFLAFAMIVVGFTYNVWFVLIGFFVLMAAGAEEAQAEQDGKP